MASLRILGADGSDKVVQLRDRKIQIGRGRDNDVVLADPEKGVSRTHAELRFENGHYVIVDLQSQNGTWVNGRRVERAEVPGDAEIVIGDYRLTILTESAVASQHVSAGPTVARPARDLADFEMRERPESPPYRQHVPASAAAAAKSEPQRSAVMGVLLIAGALVIFGTIAWVWGPGRGQASGPSTPDARPADPPAASVAADPPPADRSVAPPESAVAKTPVRGVVDRSKADRVARKPGESLDAWKTRSEALETRYAYSKAALDRRDYAAAAGGFQAILLEEPGFLDAPQLLVQANAGLRATANALYHSGQKLDAAGDWVGAAQKYEQARQIQSNIPGLNDALQRIREKLREAGIRAFAQAKQLDASGRTAEAVKEYEKAVQWLSPDDPNRQIARARLTQLKLDQPKKNN